MNTVKTNKLDGFAMTAGISFLVAVVSLASWTLTLNLAPSSFAAPVTLMSLLLVPIGFIFSIGFGFVSLLRGRTPTRMLLSFGPTLSALAFMYVALKND